MADEPDLSRLSFEEALAKLEEIVHRLESGDVPLDDSIRLYAEGEKLRAQCSQRLADAEARIERIVSGPDGEPAAVRPFEG